MSKSGASGTATGSGSERRRSRRRPILNTFSIFVVVPRKGVHRLQILDLSEEGIGFELDTEGESFDEFRINTGESLDLRLYFNQSLFLPLGVDIVRLDQNGPVRRVGAAWADRDSKGYQALVAFLKMLDGIVDVVQIEEQPPTG